LSKFTQCVADSLLIFLCPAPGLDGGIFGAVLTIRGSEDRDFGVLVIVPGGFYTSTPVAATTFS
jgi:hypothetical protein